MLCSPRSYEDEVRSATEAVEAATSDCPTDAAADADGAGEGEKRTRRKKEGMQTHAAQIELDLQRTFPNHVDFRVEVEDAARESGTKLEPLRRILLALAHAHPEVGYTQGMNFVAGWCLLVLGDETCAYWLMSALLEDVLAGYFSPGLSALRADLDLLDADFCVAAPAAHLKLAEMGCLVKFFCPRWLLCVMIGTAPSAVALRVWDIILVDSDRRPRDILRRCALAALELQTPFLMSAPGMGEAVEAIRSAGASIDNVGAFLQKVRDTPQRDAAAAKAAAAAAEREAKEQRHTAAVEGLASPPSSRMKPPLRTPSRLKSLNPFSVAAPGPPPTALRPALTPFGNLLSMFQPTPRKADAVKPRKLWGGGGENAPAPTPLRTTSTGTEAEMSPSYANATPFRGTTLTTASKKRRRPRLDAPHHASDVDSTAANLVAAAEALGVTLIGHSVSFSSDVFGSNQSGEGGGGKAAAGGDEGGDVELHDLGAPRARPGPCTGTPLRSPLGIRRLNANATATPAGTPAAKRRLIGGSGPMASWASPEATTMGCDTYESPARTPRAKGSKGMFGMKGRVKDMEVMSPGMRSPLSARSPVVRMR